MMRSWFRPLVASAAMVAVWSSTPAFAGQLADMGKMKHRADTALEAVNASPKQREQTYSILEAAMEQMRAFREESVALKNRLWDVFLTGDKVDRAEVHSIRLQMVSLFDRATGRGFDVMSDIADVFTPEQRQKLRAFRQSKGKRHDATDEGARGGGGGRGGREGRSERGRQLDPGTDTVPR